MGERSLIYEGRLIMSRAFVKEPDGDQPEWPISTQTNYVTAEGLKQLNSRRDQLLKDQQK